MPLNTQVERDGETLSIPWGHFHVAAMAVATMYEHPEIWKDARPIEGVIEDYPLAPMPLTPSDVFLLVDYGVLGAIFPEGSYTLRDSHAFIDTTDGEIFRLEPGDVLRVWRGM
jgi:hypothetical protein